MELGGAPATGTIWFSRAGQEEAEENPETFTVEVTATDLLIQAADDRGLLRAVYWLEDEMRLRRAPILELGRFRVSPRYDCRMVPGIVPGPVLLYAA